MIAACPAAVPITAAHALPAPIVFSTPSRGPCGRVTVVPSGETTRAPWIAPPPAKTLPNPWSASDGIVRLRIPGGTRRVIGLRRAGISAPATAVVLTPLSRGLVAISGGRAIAVADAGGRLLAARRFRGRVALGQYGTPPALSRDGQAVATTVVHLHRVRGGFGPDGRIAALVLPLEGAPSRIVSQRRVAPARLRAVGPWTVDVAWGPGRWLLLASGDGTAVATDVDSGTSLGLTRIARAALAGGIGRPGAGLVAWWATSHDESATTVEATPRDVVAGRTGVWLLSQMTRVSGPRASPTLTQVGARLSRVNPRTGRDLARFDLPVSPERLVQGFTGRLWVLGRPLAVVDPRTGRTHVIAGNRCTSLIADAPPGVWSYSTCSRTLRRLKPDGAPTRVSARLAEEGPAPTAMALGRDGLYLARSVAGRSFIERRSPATGSLRSRVRVTGPTDGLVYRGGSVWALDGGSGFLDRLDPVTLRGTARIRLPVRARGAARLAVGGGAAWVTDPSRISITRIDPRTEKPRTRQLDRIPRGTMPIAVATGPRATWVVTLSDGTQGAICRVRPASGEVERCLLRSR